jgi:hypothetical protein
MFRSRGLTGYIPQAAVVSALTHVMTGPLAPAML